MFELVKVRAHYIEGSRMGEVKVGQTFDTWYFVREITLQRNSESHKNS